MKVTFMTYCRVYPPRGGTLIWLSQVFIAYGFVLTTNMMAFLLNLLNFFLGVSAISRELPKEAPSIFGTHILGFR